MIVSLHVGSEACLLHCILRLSLLSYLLNFQFRDSGPTSRISVFMFETPEAEDVKSEGTRLDMS